MPFDGAWFDAQHYRSHSAFEPREYGSIQSALDAAGNTSSGGTVPVSGLHRLTTTIDVPDGAVLDLTDAIITHGADVYLIHVEPGGRVFGGTFDTTGGTFTKACILFDGSDGFLTPVMSRTIASGIRFRGATGAGMGTAVFFDSEDATAGVIYRVLVEALWITGFEYGIRMHRTGAATVNYINGNTVRDIWMVETRNAISMTQSGGSDGQDIDGNYFYGIDVQATANMVSVLDCAGRYNRFELVAFDWDTGTAVTFTAGSNANWFDAILGNWSTAISNSGESNVLIDRLAGFTIPTKAGVPADTDFTTPIDGLIVLDTTNFRLYYRRGGAWHYIAETA